PQLSKMMRVAVFLAVVLSVNAAVGPRPLTNLNSKRVSKFSSGVGLDLCPLCVQFTGDTIDELINIILNAGVIGTCGELCELLAEKTGSKALGAVCDILCDIAGIEEFIKLINKADLDPIYFCELIRQCPINDHGDARITDLAINPVVAPQGKRAISFTLQSQNGTGTGELILFVRTVDGIPVEDSILMKASSPSEFPMTQNFVLDAEPDPDCDPTQDFCENWLPGNYTLIVDICNGECGSAHPHSQIYDRKQTNFTIIN
ncbi:saposin domain-containing protein, partial [Escherichia coli]|nr:saposin domain-containing protein [Escherichia coli]